MISLKIKILISVLLVIAINHTFAARPKQHDILNHVLTGKLKYGLFCGGVGSGKTATGSHFALDRIGKNPETIGFIGANTYKQLDQSTLKAFFGFLNKYSVDYTFNKAPKYGYVSQFKKHDGIISFPNGSQIITRSLDNYEDIRGIEIGWFWIDETRDTKKDAWDVLKARLRCKKSKLLCGMLTSTPNGYDWMYVEFEEKPNQASDKALNIGHGYVICSTRENEKNLPVGYIEELESSYDPLVADQEIGGLFVNVRSGRVYREFVREKHVIDYKYNPMLPIILCLDFNVDPMKWALIQKPDRRDIIFDEISKNNTDTPAMAKAVKEKYPNAVIWIYGDYSGWDRDTRSRTTDIDIVKEVLNIPESRIRIKTHPAVSARVNSVNARFNNVRGERNLFVTANCIHAIKDFENVVYDKNGKIEKNVTDPIKKQLSHISDAIGYYIEYEYSLKGKPSVRVEDAI